MMNKADLVNILFKRHADLSHRDAKEAVDLIIQHLSRAIANNEGVEIRGFGSFSRKTRSAYTGKHPKNLKKIEISKKYIPFFKAGKSLKETARKVGKQ